MPSHLQRKSPRLKDCDYTQAGAYFVTICTHHRLPLFGKITPEALMVLNPTGEIAAHYWHTIPDHFPQVELDAFVVMPNHVHGILLLGVPPGDPDDDTPPSPPLTEAFGKPVPGSLSTIIRSYKSIVSREIRKAMNQEILVWQGRFHDHIIRNEASLHRIREYVATNPARWREDTFFAE